MYQALYRKWRPQVFTDVSGQSAITRTLQSEVASGKTSHAYLFTGSRGTGKTTCAKILAKAVNCLNPHNGNPCCKCEICQGIDSGAVLDVTEIDAASNNGVDNIRDLREETGFAPSKAKNRVYIIDEVHMLSAGAFNALLKTLEEPPEHVVFILATTEVHKLPATILSRCQRFDFRRIPAEDIAARLLYVAKEEKLSLDSDAALLIGRVADGALRDALSILDQCAGKTDRVTLQVVGETAGLLGRDYLFEISDAVNAGDGAKALSVLDRLHSSSCDMERLLSELVDHFRNILIAKTVQKPEKFIVCPPEELKKLKSAAQSFTYAALLSITETLCANGELLRRSAFQRAQTEVLLLKLCVTSLSEDYGALSRRLSDLERDMKHLKSGAVLTVTEEKEQKPKPIPPPEPKPIPPPEPKPIPPPEPKPVPPPEPKPIPPPEPRPIPPPEPKPIPPPEPKPLPAPVPVKAAANLENKKEPSLKERSPAIYAPEAWVEDKPAPLADWADVLDEVSRTNKMLHGALLGSTCEVVGGKAVVKAKNTTFEMYNNKPAFAGELREAIFRVTGRRLQPVAYEVYHQKETGEENPLDTFLERAKALGADITVEEESEESE